MQNVKLMRGCAAKLPWTLVILVLSVQLHFVQDVKVVEQRPSLFLPSPYRLVAERFVDDPSDTATINSNPNHDSHVLGEVLCVLLGSI